MKKIILGLIILTCIGLISATTEVYVEPQSSVVDLGDNFVISVSIDTNESVYAISFDLSFPGILEGLDSGDGGFLGKDGANISLVINEINNTSAKYSFVATRLGVQTGVSGTGAIANITFNASNYGEGDLIISNVQIASSPPVQSILVDNIINGTVKVNRHPVLELIGDKTVNESSLLEFFVNASDADDSVLTYSASGLPTGASFSGQKFSWTPSYEQAGVYQVNFSVSDGYAVDSETITITVNNVNRKPVINWFSPSNLVFSFREGLLLLFKHVSSDADNDVLTYSWRLDDVEKATTQNWSYSLTESDCGLHIIKLEVSDSEDVVSKEWNVTVNLRGDVDLNREVDILDLASIGLAYGTRPGDANWNENADIFSWPGENGEEEGDDVIDIFDLAAIGLNYGRSC